MWFSNCLLVCFPGMLSRRVPFDWQPRANYYQFDCCVWCVPVVSWLLPPLNLLLGICCSLCINTGLGPSVGAWYLTGCIKQSSSSFPPPSLLYAFPEWQFLIILGNAIRSLTTGYGNRSLLEYNSSSSQVTQSVV